MHSQTPENRESTFTAASRCLVVDGETHVAVGVTELLCRDGFSVEVVNAGEAALQKCKSSDPDVVLLAADLPDMTGQRVSRFLREFSDAYIVMLTSEDDEVDRIVALSTTVDDYVVMPFSSAELVARVRAMLRRPRSLIDLNKLADGRSLLAKEKKFGETVIDLTNRSVIAHEKSISVTQTEFELLDLLVQSHGVPVARKKLVEEVWGHSAGVSAHSVDVHIHNLRRKLSEAQSDISIQSIRGLGFRLVENVTIEKV